MQDETAKIVETILSPGPVGAVTLLISGIFALHRGWIRLGREVTKLEADLAAETARADKWQTMMLAQLQQTDRAIAVAKTATSAITAAGANNGPTQ